MGAEGGRLPCTGAFALGASSVGGLVQAREAGLSSRGQVGAVLESAHEVVEHLGGSLLLCLQGDGGNGLGGLVGALGVLSREHDGGFSLGGLACRESNGLVVSDTRVLKRVDAQQVVGLCGKLNLPLAAGTADLLEEAVVIPDKVPHERLRHCIYSSARRGRRGEHRG